jgi:hypothetical protein
VGGRRKPAHIVAEFGQDLLGTAPADARDGVEPLEGWGQRARLLFDPGLEAGDLLVPGIRCGAAAPAA